MAEKVQTITEIRHIISGMLSQRWPQEEARALTTEIIREYTGMESARQLAFGDRRPEADTIAHILAAAERAAAGEPLQYIMGYTVFCGHRIAVEPGVLIPRPETEEMTSIIIKENAGFSGTITDLCTGSGCVAVALSLAFPRATVWATDNSAAALRVAARNILSTGAAVRLIEADILSQSPESIPVSSLIVSNPPYVTESEKKEMHVNVLEHEPPEALFVTDADPLIYYRHIIGLAGIALAGSGTLWLEVNESYAGETAGLLDRDIYRDIKVIRDLRGKNRFVKAVKNG